MNIRNVEDPGNKLRIAIKKIVQATSENTKTEYINENLLHRVVINEGSKSYHTFDVDAENKVGLFLSYKSLVHTISELILEVNPDFPYSKSLASNLFEMANNQVYFAEHLPRLTSLESNPVEDKELIEMLTYLTEKLLT